MPSAGGVEGVGMRILAAGEPILVDQPGLTAYNKVRLEKKVRSLMIHLTFAGFLALPKLQRCVQFLSFFQNIRHQNLDS